ncbi:MAG TPA: glycosyltransferase [Gaiellaceae bacterium]|nr:glycosyltransferase [Gaiellaceae bacterium]
MSSGEILLVAAADEAYAGPAALALLSAAESTTHPVGCAILVDSLTPATTERVAAAFAHAGVPLQLVELDADCFAALPVHERLSRTTYGRLYLSHIQTTAERILWLDGDTLTVASIDELVSVDLNGAAVAATQDVVVPFVSSPYGVTAWQRLGLLPATGFFQAGVMLIDIARWREQQIEARTLDYARNAHDESTLADQGPLNAILAGNWMPLEPRWNARAKMDWSIAIGRWVVSRWGIQRRQDFAILHFFGARKPWRSDHPPTPDRSTYRRAWRRLLPDFPLPAP